jgi:hypothetical protein
MKDSKGTFDILASVEKHIKALKPLLPRQAIVCIGEYPIKILLKPPSIAKDGPLPILIRNQAMKSTNGSLEAFMRTAF